MQTYTLIKEKGHIMVSIDGKKALIDTGSPITVSEYSFEFNGEHYSPAKSIMGFSCKAMSELSGLQIDILIGNDILSKNKIRVRYQEGFIDIGNDIPDNEIIQKMNYFMGLTFPITLDGKNTNAILDTGAFISYINKDFVSQKTVLRQQEDFYPLIGKFTTDVYSISTSLDNAENIQIEFGVLPQKLYMTFEMMMTMLHAEAVVGTQLLEHYNCTIDWDNKIISWGKPKC